MEKLGGNSGKLIKQIIKANGNHQLVFQKYDVSNRDILRTDEWHSFLGYHRGREGVEIIVFMSLGSYALSYNLNHTYYWNLDI